MRNLTTIHFSKTRKALFAVLLLIFAALVGAVSYEIRATVGMIVEPLEFAELHGLSEVDAGLALLCPATLNEVFELVYDENRDGEDDVWSVSIRTYGSPRCMYHLTDLNSDGVPDTTTVQLDPLRATYNTADEDEDAVPDRAGLSLANHSNPFLSSVYYDLDLDGRIDRMVEVYLPHDAGDKTKAESYILLDNAWHKDLSLEKGRVKDRRKARITEGERTVTVVFANGNWQYASTDELGENENSAERPQSGSS